MRTNDRIIDDSGHNLDETVINVLNDLAHEPQPKKQNGTLNQLNTDLADNDAFDTVADLHVDL